MAIKKHDFVEIEYTGKVKESNIIFDTTSENVAKDNGIFNPQQTYGPIVACVGEQYLVKGLDADIIGKDVGKFTVLLQPENAFGKKDARMVQLIPTQKFKKQGVNPVPGLQVNIDNHMGVIKTVSGGRTLVDFNHPLSGQEVEYAYEIKQIVTDKKAKVLSILKMFMGGAAPDLAEKDGKFVLTMEHELPEQISKALVDKVKELTDVELTVTSKSKDDKQPAAKQPVKVTPKTEEKKE